MTTLSKQYSEILRAANLDCKQLVHPSHGSNLSFVMGNMIGSAIGGVQFFFPLFFVRIPWAVLFVQFIKMLDVISAALDGKLQECDVATIFRSFENVLWIGFDCIVDWTIGHRVHVLVPVESSKLLQIKLKCLSVWIIFSNCLGRFYFRTLMQIPLMIAGWPIFFPNEKIRQLFGHTAATIVIEHSWIDLIHFRWLLCFSRPLEYRNCHSASETTVPAVDTRLSERSNVGVHGDQCLPFGCFAWHPSGHILGDKAVQWIPTSGRCWAEQEFCAGFSTAMREACVPAQQSLRFVCSWGELFVLFLEASNWEVLFSGVEKIYTNWTCRGVDSQRVRKFAVDQAGSNERPHKVYNKFQLEIPDVHGWVSEPLQGMTIGLIVDSKWTLPHVFSSCIVSATVPLEDQLALGKRLQHFSAAVHSTSTPS